MKDFGLGFMFACVAWMTYLMFCPHAQKSICVEPAESNVKFDLLLRLAIDENGKIKHVTPPGNFVLPDGKP